MRVPTDIKDLGTLAGPLLLFGGAYSNLQALEALRADAEHLGIPPANVICTGDTPGYCADPAASLDLVERWGIHAIAGNVETNLVEGGDDCGCGFGDGSRCDMFAKLWYTFAAANVTTENLAYMAELPDILLFNYAGHRVAVLHGSPSNQSEFVWASTDPERKADYLKDLDADVIIGGHSGLPFTDYLDGQQSIWLNPGVIGMPANDATPRTWYATLNDTGGALRITFHPLHYNHAAAKARMLDDRRLPVSYAATLTTGIWDNTEIMPPEEEARQGIPLVTELLALGSVPNTTPPAAAPNQRHRSRSIRLNRPWKINIRTPKTSNPSAK